MTTDKFVIATDSRRCDELLFMVDRSKQRKSFWSNRLDDVFVFSDRDAAKAKCRTLRFNNPRVMTLKDAWKYERVVENARMHEQAMSDSECGWDAHKSYF